MRADLLHDPFSPSPPFCGETSGERGATMVEFALTIGIFLAALIFFVDMVQLTFRLVTAQYVASQAIRTAVVTSGVDPVAQENYANVRNPPSCEDRTDLIIQTAIDLGHKLGLPQLSSENVFVCPAGGGSCTVNDPGKARSFIQLEIEVPLRIFLFNQDFTVRTRAVARNELFVSCI